MWMSGQQKQPVDPGEGMTGTVTLSDGQLAVLLDSERRGVETYAPAGYQWNPEPGQRVLVIQGKGEIPCVVGVRQGGDRPKSVRIVAKQLTAEGDQMTLSGRTLGLSGDEAKLWSRDKTILESERVDLNAQVYIRGELLEDFIRRIAGGLF